jgi:hypothetical protein
LPPVIASTRFMANRRWLIAAPMRGRFAQELAAGDRVARSRLAGATTPVMRTSGSEKHLRRWSRMKTRVAVAACSM